MANEHLGPLGHTLAQYALARLDMLEMAYSRLPGADQVDLAEVRREAGRRWERRCPYLSKQERDEVLDETLRRMTEGSAAPERD